MKNKCLIFSSLLILISLALSYLSKLNTSLAVALDREVSARVRSLLSVIFDLFPFSLFEIAIILSPIILAILLILIIRTNNPIALKQRFYSILCVFSLFIAVFIFALPKGRTELSERYIDTTKTVHKSEIVTTAKSLVEKIEEYKTEEKHSKDVLSDIQRNIKKASHGYGVSYIPRAKPTLLFGVLSHLDILGYYSYFTGEIIINIDVPTYYLPFATAHEYMHHLGAKNEADANFCAFLLCLTADEEYIRYSAYAVGIEYFLADISSFDRDLYNVIYSTLPEKLKSDLNSWADFYKDTSLAVGNVSNGLHSAFLEKYDKYGSTSYNRLSKYITIYFSLT